MTVYKAKDLVSPFQWSGRKVLLQDHILHVPPLIDDYNAFSLPEWKEIFENDNPVRVEYCSGNGDWIAQKAEENPDVNYVAVEMKFCRVRKIWAKLKTRNLPNLFVICGEAHLVTERYFPMGSIDAVYLNFPDPWPKKRHAKHRLVKPAFVEEVHRAMRPGGSFTFVSDDQTYTGLFVEEMDAYPHFSQTLYTNTLPEYGGSWFDALWRRLGRDITYVSYTADAR